MSDPIKVLVVCTGNLCRSPLVEALLDREFAEAGIEANVTSAGLAAPVGAKPDRKMLKAAGEAGIDLSRHRSRLVDIGELEIADIVIGMTAEQRRQLQTLMPSLCDRAVVLRVAVWKAAALRHQPIDARDWIGQIARGGEAADQDLADPIGRPLRAYRDMVAEARLLTRRLVRDWPGR